MQTTSRPYQRIIAWREAYKLCLMIYRATTEFPSYEKFGLTSQIRKAASSVPLNIAEGNAKRTRPDKVRFMDIALASMEEVHCTLLLSRDLKYISEQKFDHCNQQVHRTCYLLIRLRDALAR